MYRSWKQAYSDVVEGKILKEEADLMLPRGEQKILQVVSDKVDRGLRVKLLNDGGYDMQYWLKDSSKGYPVEVLVDGKSVKKDAELVTMKFHPELKEDGHEQSANVMNQLSHIKRNVEQLMAQVKPDLEYPQWWVNKLVKSADYLDSATDFLQNKIDQAKVEDKK